MSDIKQRMDELAKTIEAFNYTSAVLRDKLHSSVPIPFHIDPLMHVTISFEEPIPVEELIATELFDKHYIEISSIRIIDQRIEFTFAEDGEDTLEYDVLMYDNINNIMFWEYYLLSLVAPILIEHIKGKREEINKFIDFLNEAMKVGEKNE